MSAESPTGAMSALYEQSREPLEEFVRPMPRHEGQVGAVFSIGDNIAGVDALGSAATFQKVAEKLMRSYAIDAIEWPSPADASVVTTDAIRAFLSEVAVAEAGRFKAIGLGDDLRLKGLGLLGAALEIDQQVVHLVAFPRSLMGEEPSPGYPRAFTAHAGMRRRFE